MRFCLFFVFLLPTLLVPCQQAYAGVPRIAIMPADKETSSSTLSDLVSVELSSQDSVQVVERSEIDRVLKEQDMSATGLTDVKSRIALGKLLKADGFLFLEKSAKDDRISARLVETVQGFQVGYAFYPTREQKTVG